MVDKQKIVNVDCVDINDVATRTPFPLIEKPKGTVTNERCLSERFYNDQYLCSAERNYYVDRYHELCLLAHYGKRTPGKYEIVPGYEYFVTKKRMCLDIYWNLGHLSDESVIVEKYSSLDDAKKSEYYSDFCELKEKIDEKLEYNRTHMYDEFDYNGTGSFFDVQRAKNSDLQYRVYQYTDSENRQFIQLYQNIKTKTWDKMSISLENLCELMRYFKDFDELDKNELHLRTWLPIKENALNEGSKYHYAYEWADNEDKTWHSLYKQG